MDIQIASNFERYLFYLNGEDAENTASQMNKFKNEGRITVMNDILQQVQIDFSAYGVGNDECLNTISEYYQKYDYLLDPHTACGIAATDKLSTSGEATIVLSTAHPAKFDEAIRLRDIRQDYPEAIRSLFDKPQFQTIVDGKNEAVRQQLVAFFKWAFCRMDLMNPLAMALRRINVHAPKYQNIGVFR